MNKFLLFLVFLSGFAVFPTESQTGIGEATEIIGVIRLGVSLVDYIYKVFSKIFKDSNGFGIPEAINGQDLDTQLLTEYKVISGALDRLGSGFEDLDKTIHVLQKELPKTIRRELKLDRVDYVVRTINNNYKMFEYYQEHKNTVERHTLEDFAKSATSHGDGSIRTNLDELHSLIVPHEGLLGIQGVVTLLANGFKEGKHLCGLGQSPHQIIYNLYNVIALTEIKGYAMIQFSYMMLRLYGKGNFTVESDLARKSFESQATEKLLAIKNILPELSRDYWKCDPIRQVEGSTYVRMTNLLQGFIENEVDMNPQKTCKSKCSAYSVTKNYGCFKNLFCAKQDKCNGRLFDCTFYHADSWVCMSQSSDRRYDWIEYEDHTLLGNKGQNCPNKIKVDSWWRWLFWHCSYCLCKCDQPGPKSDRYWSLKSVESDIENNRIITGVRFVKKNRVIGIEIEEGLALPEGGVDESTRQWKETPKDVDISNEDGKNVDYMEMSYEQRALDLDTLRAPHGHVITGLKFRNIGGHLNLEAKITPIRFSTGKLRAELSTWISNDNTPATEVKRKQLEIVMPDIPTHFKGHSTVDSNHNQYLLFDATCPDKDVMQTTIPYIDAQKVSSKTATWLGGIGLYHKGKIGYGGYVGLSIVTYDFSEHLLPKNNEGRSAENLLRYDFQTENAPLKKN